MVEAGGSGKPPALAGGAVTSKESRIVIASPSRQHSEAGGVSHGASSSNRSLDAIRAIRKGCPGRFNHAGLAIHAAVAAPGVESRRCIIDLPGFA
jgi:hypothetical protein